MITVERRGAATWITLDRPDKLNAFTGEMQQGIRLGVEQAVDDPDVRAVVLTGRGRAFSVGADRSLLDGSASEADMQLAADEFPRLLETVGGCEKPVVAAVNGLAVGLGSTILLHCDLVLVAVSARLRFPFTALGVPPEAGSSYLLPARARFADAMWSMLSSEWIDAESAVTMGLAWRAVADEALLDETERVVETLAAVDPRAVAATKRLLLAGRADAVRAAYDRELAEWALLRGDAE